MTKLLDKAVAKIKELPEEAQEALAQELLERVEDFATLERDTARQALIKKRLERPLRAVSRDDLMAMLRKYNPVL